MTITFRALRRQDFALVGFWISRPHVARWWREPAGAEDLEANYGPAIDGSDPTEVFIVGCDGEPVGLIQRYETDDNPKWKRALEGAGVHEPSAGIDYLIGSEERTGRGLGPEIIERFAAEIWRRYPAVALIAVAVQQGNRASWRALEKAGFERAWAGTLDSDDPSDDGPSYVYVRRLLGAGE